MSPKRLSLFVLLCLIAGSLLAQSPTVKSIDPNKGPVAGGSKVTITGSDLNIPANFACILPCPTIVSFGGTAAVTKEWTNERLVVLTPPHVPATVNVVLQTPDGRTATVANGFTFTATGENGYEMLLLPVYLDKPVAGANGSMWKTDLWIRNSGATGLTLAPWVCPENTACPAIFPLTRTLNAGESLHNLPVRTQATANPARLLYISRDASFPAIQLRVFDSSRAAANAGTELPVVHEDDFLSAPVSLLTVPLDARFRSTLRIYEVRSNADGTPASSDFRVRIYSQVEGRDATLLADKTITATSTQGGQFRDEPGFGQIANLTEGIFAIENAAPLRVDIEPLTQGSRYWPMISITNNDTQLITTITPQ